MAATPSAPILIHTPPTPRHPSGTSHHFTRKSTRINTTPRSRALETPPPRTTHTQPSKSSMSHRSPTTSSAGSVPQPIRTSPRNIKNRTTESNMMEAEALQPPTGESSRNNVAAPSKPWEARATHMLPTPASLPRKKQIPRAEIAATARVLFPTGPDLIDDPMPLTRKGRRNRKHRGFSINDPDEVEASSPDDKVPIYTDSRDKVPELDHKGDNPFLDQDPASSSNAPNSRGKKRKAQNTVIPHPQIEEAFNRDKGMVYVFRGKKIYRPFPKDSDSEQEDTSLALDNQPHSFEDTAISRLRPLTRSSIKPRLLFPNASRTAVKPITVTESSTVEQSESVVTPVKKSFEPVTPPATRQKSNPDSEQVEGETRSKGKLAMDVDDTETNTIGERKKKVSPFDGWARTKPGFAAPKGKKREAEELKRDDGDDGKRIRSGMDN